jgi:hypothetical protein
LRRYTKLLHKSVKSEERKKKKSQEKWAERTRITDEQMAGTLMDSARHVIERNFYPD